MHRVMRGGLCALVASCALAFVPASHAAADSIPPQGVYDWCDPAQSADGCGSRLDRIGNAGFRVVLNVWVFNSTTESQLRAYAQRAQATGVKVLWALSAMHFERADPNGNSMLSAYPALARNCGCSTNQGLLQYLIGVLRGLPGTYGYYLADEPGSSAHDQLASMASRVKALDPDHPRIIVGCGFCNGGTDGNVGWMADIDTMLGTDAYPVIWRWPDPDYSYNDVAANAIALDRIAAPAGRGQVMVLQSWRWGDSISDSQAIGVDPTITRYPERDEIQAQRDAAIQNSHPDLILWFVLTQVIGWEPGQRNPNWTNPTDTTKRWDNLVGGAFAPPPGPRPVRAAAASTATAASSSPQASATAANQNDSPLARLSVARDRRARIARSPRRRWFVADGRSSRDPDGRIARYAWRLNGKILPGGGSGRRGFTVRVGKRNVLTLTVTDDHGARATARRTFRVRT
jgi:hypothetical protein